MTQIEAARAGQITEEVKFVAAREGLAPDELAEGIARGEVIIPKGRRHALTKPIGIGRGLRTKVNANVGTSTDFVDVSREVEKARVAVVAGADAVMDLSTGGDLTAIRRGIMAAVDVPLGTVPIYQAAIEAIEESGALVRMSTDKVFDVIERQAQEGVDFVTVHCGVTREVLQRLRAQGRITDIVSRGGAFLTTWMVANDRENPLYEDFDRLLEIAGRYDLTLSLGDGLRPGSIADATDRAQIQELIVLGELTQRAWDRNIQVMIEGPGHVPLDQVEANVLLEKRLCHNAPFYVLGPLVTDVAPGYDHIACAIGGAVAARAGADFLCYVTPGEHLRLPNVDEVRQGVIAARIAAHAGDIAKGISGAVEWDRRMSRARLRRDWEEQMQLSMDPELFRRVREEGRSRTEDVCSMCGDYCALKLVEEALHGPR